jgi:tRNA-specific 2-thiouridylase
MAHVVVGLSGGVDSAVAALLLKQQGHHVTGLFMKNWEEDDSVGHCTAEEDLKVVRAVCEILTIPLQTVNFSSEYWDRVFQYFLDEHRAGRTPNPDVLCNKEIKFNAFLDHAVALGADRIATGHYAQIQSTNDNYQLIRGADPNKDQTYFLYTLGQRELAKSLFPVGHLTKPAVRALARDAGLPNYDRKDSTGICFIGERDFRDFLKRYLPAHPGEMRTLAGEFKGRHEGVMYYTIGQRQGLGIGGEGLPWYVVDKDIDRNILYVEQGEDHPALFNSALLASQLHWVTGHPPSIPLNCAAKVRYRQADQPCAIGELRNGVANVRFNAPQRAVTPGQSVVFYDGRVCLGGGIIDRRLNDDGHSGKIATDPWPPEQRSQ